MNKADQQNYLYFHYHEKDQNKVQSILQCFLNDGFKIEINSSTMNSCKIFVVFLTNHFYESKQCIKELETMMTKKIPIIWIELEDTIIPEALITKIAYYDGITYNLYANNKELLKEFNQFEMVKVCKQRKEEQDMNNKYHLFNHPITIFIVSTILCISCIRFNYSTLKTTIQFVNDNFNISLELIFKCITLLISVIPAYFMQPNGDFNVNTNEKYRDFLKYMFYSLFIVRMVCIFKTAEIGPIGSDDFWNELFKNVFTLQFFMNTFNEWWLTLLNYFSSLICFYIPYKLNHLEV